MDKDSDRPLVTFALFAYNQERYVREAVEGALAQDYEPLQIILSDDCSTDQTFEIMQEIANNYMGPHQILLNKNKRNFGVGAHVNYVMSIATGDLIITAAGDDISLPNRTNAIVKFFQESGGKAISIWSRAQVIDVNGKPLDRFVKEDTVWADDKSIILGTMRPRGATHAFHRSIYEKFGPIDPSIWHEDVVLPFRSQLIGKVGYIDTSLVLYRVHSAALTHNPVGQIDSDFYHRKAIGIQRDRVCYLQMLHDLFNYESMQNSCSERVRCRRAANLLIIKLNRLSIEWSFASKFPDIPDEISSIEYLKPTGWKFVFKSICYRYFRSAYDMFYYKKHHNN